MAHTDPGGMACDVCYFGGITACGGGLALVQCRATLIKMCGTMVKEIHSNATQVAV